MKSRPRPGMPKPTVWIASLLVLALPLCCAGGDIWNRLDAPCTNLTFNLGDSYNVWISMELGQAAWDGAEVGYGKTTDPADCTWITAYWYKDGTAPNKFVRAPICIPASAGTGTWYYAGRARGESGDPWHYAGSTNWGNTTGLSPLYTITVLPASSVDTNFVIFNERTGHLIWTNSQANNEFYDVLWAPAPSGPWYDSWSGLSSMWSTDAVYSVDVPVFYRVRQRATYTALERMLLPATGVTNVSSVVMTNGHRYQITIDSYYRFNTDNPNYGQYADAEYLQDTNQVWVPIVGGGLGVQCSGFMLEPFSESVESHLYKYNVLGFGEAATFRVYDPENYTDNDGSVYVTIYDVED
ncbi:MAG: hypothetical protein AB7T27_03065 [Kiritimatiellia bacterium]